MISRTPPPRFIVFLPTGSPNSIFDASISLSSDDEDEEAAPAADVPNGLPLMFTLGLGMTRDDTGAGATTLMSSPR